MKIQDGKVAFCANDNAVSRLKKMEVYYKMKVRKKVSLLLSIVLILSLVVAGLTVPASADGEPVAVSSAEEFLAMAYDGSYYLTADISLTGKWSQSTSGSPFNYFGGTLDGKGHTVTISGRSMFSNLGGNALVKNLIIEGTLGGDYLGALSGETDGNNVFNICVENVTNHASGNSAADWGYSGGFFGNCYVKNSTCSITLINCTNTANITASGHTSVGGFIGSLRGGSLTMINCVNTGNVVGKQDAGGLVGRWWRDPGEKAVVQNCKNTGSVQNSTNMYAGGAIGWVHGTLELSNFVNTGAITSSGGAMGAGGFIGGAHKSESDKQFSATITKCVNEGTISGGGSIGAFVGSNNGAASTCTLNISECIDKSGNANLIGEQKAGQTTLDTSKTEGQIKNLGYDDDLDILSIQPGLGEDIAFYIAVDGSVAKDYYTVTATMNEKTTELEYVRTDANENLVYVFHIAPQNMGDGISFSLVLGEQEQDTIADYSFLIYCNNMMGKGDAKLDQLLKDALEYGAAAQTYKNYKTGSLVNAGISGATVYADLGAEANVLNFAANGGYTGAVELTKVGMYFDYNNRLSFVIENVADIDTISVTVGGNDLVLDESNTVDLGGNSYRIYFKDLLATDICSATSQTVVVSDGGTAVGTLTYNARSYVYAKQGLDNNMGALAKALYNYSLSAAAYAE